MLLEWKVIYNFEGDDDYLREKIVETELEDELDVRDWFYEQHNETCRIFRIERID